MRHLILIGLPGSGKTTVGQQVSRMIGLPLTDLDETVEEKEKMPIPQLFSRRGEAYFRKLEAQVLREALQGEPCVISTGGGVVLSPENRELLKKSGFVVFLDRRVEDILRTLDISHRPILQDTTLSTVAEVRRPLYLSCADACVTENEAEAAAQQCAALWRKQA